MVKQLTPQEEMFLKAMERVTKLRTARAPRFFTSAMSAIPIPMYRDELPSMLSASNAIEERMNKEQEDKDNEFSVISGEGWSGFCINPQAEEHIRKDIAEEMASMRSPSTLHGRSASGIIIDEHIPKEYIRSMAEINYSQPDTYTLRLCQDCPIRKKKKCSLGYTIGFYHVMGDRKALKASADCKLNCILTDDKTIRPRTFEVNGKPT